MTKASASSSPNDHGAVDNDLAIGVARTHSARACSDPTIANHATAYRSMLASLAAEKRT